MQREDLIYGSCISGNQIYQIFVFQLIELSANHGQAEIASQHDSTWIFMVSDCRRSAIVVRSTFKEELVVLSTVVCLVRQPRPSLITIYLRMWRQFAKPGLHKTYQDLREAQQLPRNCRGHWIKHVGTKTFSFVFVQNLWRYISVL